MVKQTRPGPSNPKPAKKAKKETKPSKAQLALDELPYEIHASQRALAERCFAMGQSLIVCADGGDGKTGAARAFIDLFKPALTIFVSPDAGHAKDKRCDIGCELRSTFKFSYIKGIRDKLRCGEQVRVMMTHAFLKRQLADPAALVDNLFGDLDGVPTLLIIDEVDKFYATGKYPHRLAEVLKRVPALRELGMTATLGFDPATLADGTARQREQNCVQRAHMLLGGGALDKLSSPPIESYTEAERAQLRKDLHPRPDPPSAYEIIELPTPTAKEYAKELKHLQALLKGRALHPSIEDSSAIDNLVNGVLVRQLHGGKAANGGKLFSSVLSQHGVPMRLVAGDGTLGAPAKKRESVLIYHANPYAAETHLELLRGAVGQDGVRKFAVHDLRRSSAAALKEASRDEDGVGDDNASDSAALAAARQAFLDDFLGQEKGAVLGVVDPTQARATDYYGANVNAVVIHGKWKPSEETQTLKRPNRAGPLGPGELVSECKAFKITSPWANAIGKAVVKRGGIGKGAELSAAAKALLEQLAPKDEEDEEAEERYEGLKQQAMKLSLVATGVDLAQQYLDSLVNGETSDDKYAYDGACGKYHCNHKWAERLEEEEGEEEEEAAEAGEAEADE
jgi:hypothetical protein